VTMYDHLQSFLARGGSLLYLGGNGIYESANYTSDQTGMIFRAGVEGGPREAACFACSRPPSPNALCSASPPKGAGWSELL